MKKYLTLVVLLILAVTVNAQDRRDGKMKFDPESHRLHQHQFMMKEAELSKEDSVRFFAVYDEMREKEFKLFGDNKVMRNKRPETDDDCLKMIIHRDSVELQLKEIQMDYHQRLVKLLSPKKALRAIMAGEEFDRKAFRQMNSREPREDGMRGGPKGKMNRLQGKRTDGPRPDGPRPDGPRPEDD